MNENIRELKNKIVMLDNKIRIERNKSLYLFNRIRRRAVSGKMLLGVFVGGLLTGRRLVGLKRTKGLRVVINRQGGYRLSTILDTLMVITGVLRYLGSKKERKAIR